MTPSRKWLYRLSIVFLSIIVLIFAAFAWAGMFTGQWGVALHYTALGGGLSVTLVILLRDYVEEA